MTVSETGMLPSRYPVGRYTLRLESRGFGGAGGLALRLYGPVIGADAPDGELLRFDCFAERPHYHVGLSGEASRIEPIVADDPFEWSVRALESHCEAWLDEVSAEPLTQSEQDLLAAALRDARRLGRAFAASEAGALESVS